MGHGHYWFYMIPAHTLRNDNAAITSKRRNFDVITSKWHRLDVITTLLLHHVFHGIYKCFCKRSIVSHCRTTLHDRKDHLNQIGSCFSTVMQICLFKKSSKFPCMSVHFDGSIWSPMINHDRRPITKKKWIAIDGCHKANYSITWWRHQMETFSALLALCGGNSPVTGEFPAQRPLMRSFDVFFDLRPSKRLCKQSGGWWFETPSRSLWRNCNDVFELRWKQYRNNLLCKNAFVWLSSATIKHPYLFRCVNMLNFGILAYEKHCCIYIYIEIYVSWSF